MLTCAPNALNHRLTQCGLFILTMLCLCGCSRLQKPQPPTQEGAAPYAYLPSMPLPKKIFVSADLETLQPINQTDTGGLNGAMAFTLQSLSGLAARSVIDGQGEAMIWLELGNNDSYAIWREDVVRLSGAQCIQQSDPWALVRDFIGSGVVKGYVLYRADPSHRAAYAELPPAGEPYSNSANAATVAAGLLGGIIVEENVEAEFKALGLPCLLDARDKDEAWAFDTYKERLSRELVMVIDPKAHHNRDYAIATRSMIVCGVTPVSDAVFAWSRPNAPIVGWNTGDEAKQIIQLSRHGHYLVPSNWCLNLPLTSCVRAGRDIAWDQVRMKPQTHIDPLELEWASDGHFSSFVMSDGDNDQWFMGAFAANTPNYWNTPSRGTMPFTWPAPALDLEQICTPALRYLSATATANDQMILQAGGYYYADEYGLDAQGHDPLDLLSERVDRLAPGMQALDLRLIALLVMDWKSEQARKAYELYAQRIKGLEGILVFQYYPYTAGDGEMMWVNNAQGEPIPVVSCKWGLWAQAGGMLNCGPPAWLADKINQAPQEGPLTDVQRFSWTIVHAWSVFKPADARQDLMAEDMPQDQWDKIEDARRGYDPARWCAQRLAPGVKVVTAEELVWRMRLHLQTRGTLDGLAARLEREAGQPPILMTQLAQYRQWLARAELNTDIQRAQAFERLKRIHRGTSIEAVIRIN